ncbi:MAG: DUF3638 domain-containing protein [Chlamydiales bacterium]|nr:DUF3638 domain-containing protein [Chlamydiales bacterium]
MSKAQSHAAVRKNCPPPPDINLDCLLSETKSASISPQLFAHIFLDGRLKDTGYEGISPYEPAHFLQIFFCHLKKAIPELGAEEAVMRNLAADITTDWTKNYVRGAQNIARRLRELKVGGSALLPGGWRTSKGGHAMLYRFERTAKGFDVMIINTGSGIETFHGEQINHHKTLCSPYVYFKDVPIELVLPLGSHDIWIQALVYFNQEEQKEEFRAAAIYQGPFREFWKYQATLEEHLNHYITPQRDGTCAWKSMLAYLRYTLAPPVYERVKSYIRLYALEAIIQTPLRMPNQAIQEGCAVFAKEVRKKEGVYYSYNESEQMLEVMRRCKQCYLVEDLQAAEEPQNATPPLTMKPNCMQGNILNANISYPDTTGRLTPGFTLLLEKPSPTTIVDVSSRLEKRLQDLSCANAREVGLQMVAHYVMQIPLENAFWEQIPKKDAAISSLTQLLRAFQQNTLFHKSVQSPQEIVVAYTLYIHIFEICALHCPAYFAGFAPQNRWYKFKTDLFFYILTPQLQTHCNLLLRHVRPKVGTSAFSCPASLTEVSHDILKDCIELKFYRSILDRDSKLRQDFIRKADAWLFEQKTFVPDSTKALAILARGWQVDFPFDSLWLNHFQHAHFLIATTFNSTIQRASDAINLGRRLQHNLNTDSIQVINFGRDKAKIDEEADIFSQFWPGFEKQRGKEIIKKVSSTQALQRCGTADSTLEAQTLMAFSQMATSEEIWALRQVGWSGVERALQPMQLFSTFQAHPDHFKDEKYASLFWLSLFKAPFQDIGDYAKLDLREIVEENPLLLPYVVSFVENGMRHFIDLQKGGEEGPNVITALFFVRVATEFGYAALHLSNQQERIAYVKMLEGCHKMIETQLHKKELSDSERGLLHTHRLHLHLMFWEMERSHFKFEEFFASWFGMHMFKVEQAHRLLGLEKVLHARMYPHLTRLQQNSEDDLSSAARAVFEALQLPALVQHKKKWMRPQRDVLTLTCDELNLNILSGEVFQDEQTLSRGSPDLRIEDPAYRHLFGRDKFLVFNKGRHCIFSHPVHGEMRILHPENLSRGVQLKRNGKWYEYQLPLSMMKLSTYSIPYSLLTKPYHAWIAIDKSCCVITHHDDWQGSVATYTKGEEAFRTKEGLWITKGVDSRDLKGLRALDHPGFQEVYYNADLSLKAVCMPRICSLQGQKLVFRMDKRCGKLAWGDDDRYKVEDQKPVHILPVEEYVSIRDDKSGNRKVLVAVHPFNPDASAGFSTTSALNTPVDKKHEIKEEELDAAKQFFYLEYDLRVMADGSYSLKPQNVEGILFLAYLRMHQRKFDEALHLLSEISLIDTLSPLSFDILKYFFKYPKENKHYAPIPIALALKAGYIFSAHKMKRGEDPIKNHFDILYRRYRDVEKGVPERFTLSVEEEMCFRPSDQRAHYLGLGEMNESTGSKRVLRSSLIELTGYYRPPPKESYTRVDRNLATSLGQKWCPIEFFWSAWEVIIAGSLIEREQLKAFLCVEYGLRQAMTATGGMVPKLNDQSLNFLFLSLMNVRALTSGRTYNQLNPDTKKIGQSKGTNKVRYWNGYLQKYIEQEISAGFITANEVLQEWWERNSHWLKPPPHAAPEITKNNPGSGPLERKKRVLEKERDLALPENLDLDKENTFFLEMLKLFSKKNIEEAYFENFPFPRSMEDISFGTQYSASVKREMNSVLRDYEEGTQQLQQRSLRDLSPDMAAKINGNLRARRADLENELKALETSILTAANVLPEEREARIHREYELESGRVKKLDMHELERLFLLRKKALFMEANPGLTEKNIEELFREIARWEVLQIQILRLFQAEELLCKVIKLEEKMKQPHKSPSPDISGSAAVSRTPSPLLQASELEEMYSLYCERIAKILEIKLSDFPPEERVPYLVFYRRSQKYPRADQRENIAHLPPKSENPCCIQMIMGAGKTSVVGPLWAQVCSDSGKLPVIFADSAQYGTLAHALKVSQKTCFEQEVFTIDFLREELTENSRLKYILQLLKEGVENKKLLILCPEMLQLLDSERFIAIQRSTLLHGPDLVNMRERLFLLNEIMHYFKCCAKGLCDEADLIWRSDKEVNLPSGDVIHISQEKVSLTRAVFEALCSPTLMVEGVSMQEYVGLQKKEQTHLTQKDWGKICPIIVHDLAKNCSILKLTKKLDLREEFVKYVMGAFEDMRAPFFQYVEQLKRSADTADQEAAELICLVKHLFQDILPLAFRQMGGRNFGRWRDQGFPLKTPGKVIPYLAADTPAHTEFAYHYEALAKHFMLAAQEGVEEAQVLYIAEEFEKMARQQMEISDETLEQTAEERAFKQMTGISLLDIRKPGKLVEATAHVNSSLSLKFLFESETANIYATYYEGRLTSTAHDSYDLLDRTQSGMTGTPWNSDGYAPEVADRVKLDVGTQGKINRRILMRKNETKAVSINPSKLLEELEKLYDKEKKTFPAGIFDSGALLSKSGLTNVEIATIILEFLQKKGVKQHAVLFFSKPKGSAQANQFTALVQGPQGPQLRLLESTSWDQIQKLGIESPNEYVLFLPERQTTGTDVAFPLLAEAYVTFDETMTMRTLHQTIMRLRDFLNKQKVHFILSPSLLAKIPPGTDPVDYILKVTVVNEAREKADSMLRSYKQMLDAEVKRQYRKRVQSWNKETPHEEMLMIANFYEPFCFLQNSDNLFDKFFGVESEIDIMMYLKAYAESIKSRLNAQSVKLNGMLIPKIQAELEKDCCEIQRALDTVLERAAQPRVLEGFAQTVRAIVDKLGSDSTNMQAEVLQEAQREVHQEVHHEQELEIELLNELQYLMGRGTGAVKTQIRILTNLEALERLANDLVKGARQPLYTRTLRQEIETFPTPPMGIKAYSRFADVFEQEIHGTENFFQPTFAQLPLFHKSARPPGQILVIQKGDGTFSYLLLSEFETTKVAELMRSGYRAGKLQNVWLMQPNGHLFVPNPPTPLPVHSSSFQAGVVELCLLFGMLSPLSSLKVLDRVKTWLDVDGERGQHRRDFVKMRFEHHPFERTILYKSQLLESSGSNGRLFCSVVRAEEDAVAVYDPKAIQMLTDPAEISRLHQRAVIHLLPTQVPHMNPRYIGLLREREQIQAVPPEKADRMVPDQVRHATLAQAVHFTSVEMVQQISKEMLQAIATTPSQAWVTKLSPTQIGWINKEDWLPRLQPKDFKHLSKEMLKELSPEGLKQSNLEFFAGLPDEIILKVPERVAQLPIDRVKRIQNQMLVGLVKGARVNELPAECAPHINIDELKHLENLAAIEKLPNTHLHHLSTETLNNNVSASRIHLLENLEALVAMFEKVPSKLSQKQLVTLKRRVVKKRQYESLLKPYQKGEITSYLTPDECRDFLREDLIRHIKKTDQLLALRERFKHITLEQLVLLVREKIGPIPSQASEDMVLPPTPPKSLSFKEIDVSLPKFEENDVRKLRVEEMALLLKVRPELLPAYRNPDILPHVIDFSYLHEELVKRISEKKHFSHLPMEWINEANPQFAHHMTAEQRAGLSQEQVSSITSQEALQSLEDISGINPNLAHLLTEEQKGRLTPEQIGKMTNQTTIFLLDKQHWPHVAKEYRKHLPFHESKSTTTVLIALSALGGVALIFALVLQFTPAAKLPSWMQKMKIKLGQAGTIGMMASGSALLLIAAMQSRRIHAKRNDKKIRSQ